VAAGSSWTAAGRRPTTGRGTSRWGVGPLRPPWALRLATLDRPPPVGCVTCGISRDSGCCGVAPYWLEVRSYPTASPAGLHRLALGHCLTHLAAGCDNMTMATHHDPDDLFADKLLRFVDVLQYVGTTRETWRKWRQQGLTPPEIRVGREIRIRES